MERRPHIPNILPHEKVFPIQIGSELFRLSGASISSDGMCSQTCTWIYDIQNMSFLQAVLEFEERR
jgi:hypothetical protein